ncbi:MAG: RDD family protein [Solirubrobacterales bacterium]
MESSAPGPEPRGPLPLGARLLGGGARGARRMAQAAGVNRAVEVAAEEAIVTALQSPAVERAVVRVLQGPAVEEAMRGALESPAVERALIDAVDSQLLDKVWQRVLASDEAQKLVERIAEAPEVRAAITSQGVGFLDDIRREIGKVARRIDGGIERVVRRVFRRAQRSEPTECAGAFTRVLAFALDVGALNLAFIAISALVAFVASLVFPSDATAPALAVGAFAWVLAGAVYLVSFWSLLGQTPGMSIVGIRVVAPGQQRVSLRLSIRRLFGLAVAVIPLGLGFAGILFSQRRRGLEDVLGHTEVRYSMNERQAPWSEL